MDHTVADLLLHPATRTPEALAVLDGDRSTSYRDLADLALRVAGCLEARAEPGARVALLLPRTTSALAVYFGAHLAGQVPVVLHEKLRPRQVARIIDHSRAALVITAGRLRPLLRDCPLPAGQILTPADATADSPPPVLRPGRGCELATLAYTSGSTGAPKGVMLSHANLVAGARIVAGYLRLTSTDRTLAVLPWSFDYGLNQVLATFFAGGCVIPQRSPFPPDICRALTAYDVTGLAAVPTLWDALTSPGSPFLRTAYPRLRYVTNSGGALAAATIRAVRTAHPAVEVYSMYGLTEAFRSTYLDPREIDAKPASVGRAIPECAVLVLGEDGTPCPPGAIGEVVHRGPTVALGYWRDPVATTDVFRPDPDGRAGEKVVYTGDFGYTDPDGDLHLVGRRDQQLKSRGIRVSLAEIEAEIMASGLATAVIVTAVHDQGPDPLFLAAVQPRAGSSPAQFSIAGLRDYCQRELPAHMRPHHIDVVEEMPLTPHGKIDRTQVSDLLTHRARS